ncbi:MAG: ABC transporter ATP-binding protein [Sneathiellaceae bacterium]
MTLLLEMRDCDLFYGKAQALHAVSLEVGQGEIVSLIGRNGAGKSTLIKAIIGLMPLHGGERVFDGRDATGLPPEALGRLGIAFVPENRRIFATLTVEENLRIATVMGRSGAWDLGRIYGLFPRLRERAGARGDTLSGGEQQMLAVGRGLLTNPRLLLLDEPTEGLAPLIVQDLVAAMQAINGEGVAILLVEQNLKVPLKLAQRQYVIDNGRIQWQGRTDELVADRARIEALISL